MSHSFAGFKPIPQDTFRYGEPIAEGATDEPALSALANNANNAVASGGYAMANQILPSLSFTSGVAVGWGDWVVDPPLVYGRSIRVSVLHLNTTTSLKIDGTLVTEGNTGTATAVASPSLQETIFTIAYDPTLIGDPDLLRLEGTCSGGATIYNIRVDLLPLTSPLTINTLTDDMSYPLDLDDFSDERPLSVINLRKLRLNANTAIGQFRRTVVGFGLKAPAPSWDTDLFRLTGVREQVVKEFYYTPTAGDNVTELAVVVGGVTESLAADPAPWTLEIVNYNIKLNGTLDRSTTPATIADMFQGTLRIPPTPGPLRIILRGRAGDGDGVLTTFNIREKRN